MLSAYGQVVLADFTVKLTSLLTTMATTCSGLKPSVLDIMSMLKLCVVFEVIVEGKL